VEIKKKKTEAKTKQLMGAQVRKNKKTKYVLSESLLFA